MVVVVEVMSEGTAHSFHISQVVAEGEEEVMVVGAAGDPPHQHAHQWRVAARQAASSS